MLNTKLIGALAATLGALPHVLADDKHIGFCTDGACTEDCPADLSTPGTGYPSCVIYDSETVFGGEGFATAPQGGYAPYIDIPEPDTGCAYIIKSPANTGVAGCGYTVGAFKNPICTTLNFKETFMIQFCCGSGDCTAAGAGKVKVRGIDYKRDAMTGSYVIKKNGTKVEPIEVGHPPEFAARAIITEREPEPKTSPAKRDTRDGLPNDSTCTSYTPDGDSYTRPADAPQIMLTNVDGGNGGVTVTISEARESSFSSSFTAGLNIGVVEASTTITFEHSITDTKSRAWQVPAGQTGKVGFTPNLMCTSGTSHCGDGDSHGEACTGYREAGEVAGTYAVIVTS